MRVGQLARKLGISPTEVINFLTSVAIETPEVSNTKLSTEQLQVALKHFDPSGKIDFSPKEEIKEELIPASDSAAGALDNTTVDENTFSQESTPSEIVQEIEMEAVVETAPLAEGSPAEEKTEVIKAPKVELAGLKVLGKIELPEKKKKEPPAEIIPLEASEPKAAPIEELPRQPRRENRPRNPRHQGSRTDREASRKNPVTLKREQEAAESERRRQEEAKLAKERRTQHYLSKVKSVPTKPARLVEEDVVELHADNTTKMPTTWLGKFWKWFRS